MTSKVSAKPKPGFLGRVKNVMEALDKTEVDYVWDNIRYMRKEISQLTERLSKLESLEVDELGATPDLAE